MTNATLSPLAKRTFKLGSIVHLVTRTTGDQQIQGRLILRDTIGPGIVQETGENGIIRVLWPKADLDFWIDQRDLEQAEPGACLLVIYHYDADGHRAMPVYRVVSNIGLSHNWTVELSPGNIIRTIRSDGLVWTFDWHPIVERVQPHGTLLMEALAEDDHAGALTVAELSVG